MQMERFIAVDNVCAWPNLTLRPDGEIAAIIFNRPYHGIWAGDVACWASTDGGKLWSERGVAAPHEPHTNRMNVAAGLAGNGDLLVLASGWNKRAEHPPEEMKDFVWGESFADAHPLVPWVCRSPDGGRTWTQTATISCEPSGSPDGTASPVPYGDIHVVRPGHLVAAMYWNHKSEHACGLPPGAYCFRSQDDGLTWGEPSLISPLHNETALLCLDETHWLAAARSNQLDLFISNDAGAHWHMQHSLTSPGEYPAHLLRLREGRILLTHGIRHAGYYGLGMRLSDDQGQTWSRPVKLIHFDDAWDGGYPSSVELHDGSIVTAYYASRIAQHQRYHMGVLRWRIEERTAQNRRRPDEY